MTLPKLYLAGPMSDLPEYNYPAFFDAADQLREVGYLVSNPAELHSLDEPLPDYSTMLAGALKASLDCDGVAVLPGWGDSRGARLEVYVALYLNRPVHIVREWLLEAYVSKHCPKLSLDNPRKASEA